jgi:hypothetical protein
MSSMSFFYQAILPKRSRLTKNNQIYCDAMIQFANGQFQAMTDGLSEDVFCEAAGCPRIADVR